MKIAVITGVSHGLGLVVAEVFLKNGWSVVGTGRSLRPDNLNQSIKYSQFDASDSNLCTDFWKQLQDEQDTTEVCLINNAGSYVSGGLVDTQPADYEKQMQSNYFSAVYMTRALAEEMAYAAYDAEVFTLFAHPDILGAATEFGIALASVNEVLTKKIYVVGAAATRQSVFYTHPRVENVVSEFDLRDADWY
ncbi:MAG TPA: SDR family NAD(P)-dependent oxidoreductase [Candidatus Saccharimonadales bacterium]|jgi:NAD(P)-dependent dehydrogenase (short-subunit alcohol dehydrogenase family)